MAVPRHVTLVLALGAALPLGAAPTVLGIQKTRFILNDEPTFLLGISYYGGLGAPRDFVSADLDDLQRHGFNWLRLWATWGFGGEDVSAVDAQGAPREPFLTRLVWLVAECDRRGLVVDVTLTRGDGEGCIPDLPAHLRAVETLISALGQYRNWYLDLANERDVGDDRYVSAPELRVLRERARELSPQLPVTASFGGHDLNEHHIRDALVTAGLDFLCPHRPRHPGSPAQTATWTREYLALAQALGYRVPIQYQEPFRRGYGDWEPVAEDFLTDLQGAWSAGAAGWCLHNGSQRSSRQNMPRRCFDLRTQRLFDQLDEEEMKVVHRARQVLTEGS